MKKYRAKIVWLSLLFAAVLALVFFVQSRAAGDEDSSRPQHMSVDWSARHVIFSGRPQGPNAREAMQDPRYRRHVSIYGGHEFFGGDRWFSGDWRERRQHHGPYHGLDESGLKRDWQFPLGANAVTGDLTGDFAYPAKFTFDVNATPSCANDFVVFPTGLPGVGGGQASIVALNQLYSGSGSGGTGICGTGQPSVMWAYNTNLSGDTAGVIYSSPVLSGDGTKVAFVETGNGAAILKILKWVSGQGTVSSATTPTHITTGNPWSTCPTTGTSCLFSLALSGGNPDTNSSPFYIYNSDILYVGDDNGVLHKFTGVFNGTPAEVVTGGWPFTVSSGNYLTGPVFDAVSGNIFVADGATSLHYLREISSTVGTCASGSKPCIGTPTLSVSDAGFGMGVFDPPTVDSASQRVFVFTGDDPSDNSAVYQVTTALASSVETIIQSGLNFDTFSGGFDKNYHSGSYASAFLYVCGTAPTTLYRIGFNSAGVMNSSKSVGSVDLNATNHGGSCSPATEILNGSNDYLFFGMYNDGNFTGCASGCVLGLNLTTMSWPPSTSAFSSIPENNALSGIIVDNVGAGGQESNIYFGPQSNNCSSPAGDGCAVKATQNGLH